MRNLKRLPEKVILYLKDYRNKTLKDERLKRLPEKVLFGKFGKEEFTFGIIRLVAGNSEGKLKS